MHQRFYVWQKFPILQALKKPAAIWPSVQDLRDRPEDFLVVSGDDALAFPQIASGMDGVISVAANSFPQDLLIWFVPR